MKKMETVESTAMGQAVEIRPSNTDRAVAVLVDESVFLPDLDIGLRENVAGPVTIEVERYIGNRHAPKR